MVILQGQTGTETLLGRGFLPGNALLLSTINGKSAIGSGYSGALKEFGFQGYDKGLELTRN